MRQPVQGCYNGPVTGIVDRIDNTIAGLCPCGGTPRPGSPYCGDDCTPTHVAEDTDTAGPGIQFATPMRWRPDLVTEVDDTGLTLINVFRRGRFTAQIFERAGTDGVHCRLDDGHRFVGLDADGNQLAAEDGLNPIWDRLERELTDPLHAAADDPWADVMQFHAGVITPPGGAWGNVTWVELGCTEDGIFSPAEPNNFVLTFDNSEALRRRAATEIVRAAADLASELRPAFERMRETIASARPALEQLSRALGQSVSAKPEASHPMLAAIERRRNRNTGPEPRRRAPRQINPTRR